MNAPDQGHPQQAHLQVVPSALPPPLVRLSAMVVKTGLGLGQMSDGDRLLALALPAWRLPHGQEHSEAQVNELLKSSLDAESAFLRTDHVELRRWLVDTGWWRRDGFGRAYCRAPVAELPPAVTVICRAFSGLVDPAAWALQQVNIYRAAQRERRARWSESAEAALPVHGATPPATCLAPSAPAAPTAAQPDLPAGPAA